MTARATLVALVVVALAALVVVRVPHVVEYYRHGCEITACDRHAGGAS
jgi:hypothetical protein